MISMAKGKSAFKLLFLHLSPQDEKLSTSYSSSPALLGLLSLVATSDVEACTIISELIQCLPFLHFFPRAPHISVDYAIVSVCNILRICGVNELIPRNE